MENTIAFTYNPYTYFESYKNVIKNVRLYYPNSDVFIYMDNFRNDLQKYLDVSYNYKCNISIRNNSMFYIDRNEDIQTNLPKMVEWVKRIKTTCDSTNAEWIMLLEDDVLIKRKILRFPSTECGKNRDNAGFLGGGSVFRRETFLNIFKKINEEYIENIIKSNHIYSWAGDVLLQNMFSLVNATSEKWIELAEPNYYDNTDHAVFHGYKDLHKLG